MMPRPMHLFPCLLVAACTTDASEPARDSSGDYAEISTLEVKAAIARANEWRRTKPDVTSFVTQRELTVKFADGREWLAPMPAAEAYVAVAPYVERTHPCATHYLSKCDGELKGATFRVTVKDETGAVVVDRDVTALDNGFFELWLPRDKTLAMHVAQGARSADVTVPTSVDSPTCVTTPRLQ